MDEQTLGRCQYSHGGTMGKNPLHVQRAECVHWKAYSEEREQAKCPSCGSIDRKVMLNVSGSAYRICIPSSHNPWHDGAEPQAREPQSALALYYAQKNGCPKKHDPRAGKICLECVEDALVALRQTKARELELEQINNRILRQRITELEHWKADATKYAAKIVELEARLQETIKMAEFFKAECDKFIAENHQNEVKWMEVANKNALEREEYAEIARQLEAENARLREAKS